MSLQEIQCNNQTLRLTLLCTPLARESATNLEVVAPSRLGSVPQSHPGMLPPLARENATREEVVAHSRLRSVAMSDMLGKLSEPSQEPEQDSQNNFGTNGGTGGLSCDSSKTTNTDVGIGKHTFNQEAVDFVPGQVW